MNTQPDPRYVIIGKEEAARICGMSIREFDRRRASDPRCPKGFKEGVLRQSKVLFRQHDIYEYNALRIETGERIE
ncbi:hypothetical protein R84865_002233 [Carnimonas sp. R-84865]